MATPSNLDTALAQSAEAPLSAEDSFAAFLASKDTTQASTEAAQPGANASDATLTKVVIGKEEFTPQQAETLVSTGKQVLTDVQSFGVEAITWRNTAFAQDAQAYDSLETIVERNAIGDLFFSFPEDQRGMILDYAKMLQDGESIPIITPTGTSRGIEGFEAPENYARIAVNQLNDDAATVYEAMMIGFAELNDRIKQVGKSQVSLKTLVDPLFSDRQDEHTARAMRIHLGDAVTADNVRMWREQFGINDPLLNNAAAVKALYQKPKASAEKPAPEGSGGRETDTFIAGDDTSMPVEQRFEAFRSGKKPVYK